MTGPAALSDGHEHWPRYTDPALLLARTEHRLAASIKTTKETRVYAKELSNENDSLRAELAQARAWAKAWKRAAKRNQADWHACVSIGKSVNEFLTDLNPLVIEAVNFYDNFPAPTDGSQAEIVPLSLTKEVRAVGEMCSIKFAAAPGQPGDDR